MNKVLDKLIVVLLYTLVFTLVITAAAAISLAMILRGWGFWEVTLSVLAMGTGLALASHLLLEFAERKISGD